MGLKEVATTIALVTTIGGVAVAAHTFQLEQEALAAGQQQNTTEIEIIKTKERYRDAESEYLYYHRQLRDNPNDEYLKGKAQKWLNRMEELDAELKKLKTSLKGEWP